MVYEVTAEKAALRNITEMITANGKIQPETDVKITPDVAGEIVELAVKDGDAVKKGQFLLKIKPDVYMSARDRTVAALNGQRQILPIIKPCWCRWNQDLNRPVLPMSAARSFGKKKQFPLQIGGCRIQL